MWKREAQFIYLSPSHTLDPDVNTPIYGIWAIETLRMMISQICRGIFKDVCNNQFTSCIRGEPKPDHARSFNKKYPSRWFHWLIPILVVGEVNPDKRSRKAKTWRKRVFQKDEYSKRGSVSDIREIPDQ